MYAWLMHLMSKMFGKTAKENMDNAITSADYNYWKSQSEGFVTEKN